VNEKNRNLAVRLGTAFLLLPIIIWLVVRGGLYTALLLGLASAVCAGEYYVITLRKLSAAAWVGLLLAGVFPLLPLLQPGASAQAAFWLTGGFMLFAWIFHLLRGPLQEAPVLAAHLLMGLLFASVGLTALSALRLRADGFEWVICALTITWLNDTAAYFAGRFLGKRKLYVEVSPNKTWEGFFGGLAGSVVGMFGCKFIFFPTATVQDCLILGVCGGLLGPLGDLSESMLKRAYKVKDSGKSIPGHGGMLDRLDALLFNGPLVYLYVQFVRGAITG